MRVAFAMLKKFLLFDSDLFRRKKKNNHDFFRRTHPKWNQLQEKLFGSTTKPFYFAAFTSRKTKVFRTLKTRTRDLAPKAKVLRCHRRRAPWWGDIPMGVACQYGGTTSMGGVTFPQGGNILTWDLTGVGGGGEAQASSTPELRSVPILLRAFFKGSEVTSFCSLNKVTQMRVKSQNRDGRHWRNGLILPRLRTKFRPGLGQSSPLCQLPVQTPDAKTSFIPPPVF